MTTRIFTHADVVRNLDALTLLGDLREAFKASALSKRPQAVAARSVVSAGGAVEAVLPGMAPGVAAYSVRVQAHAPGGRGAIHLFDLESGALLAILDAAQITAVRTGAMGALAADVLARSDASRVAMIGAGARAAMQLKSLRMVRSLSHVRVFDLNHDRSVLFSARMHGALSLPVRAANSVEEAVADADIVVCATGSRTAFLEAGMVPPGCHVSSLGADAPGRQELSPSLIRSAPFFCDDRALALSSAGLGEDLVVAELGEVMASMVPGRTSKEQVTLFASAGTPQADLLAAWLTYEASAGDEAIRTVDFSS